MNATLQASTRACGPHCTIGPGAATQRAAAIVALGRRSGAPSYLGVALGGCRTCAIRRVRQRLEALDQQVAPGEGVMRWYREPLTPEQITRFGGGDDLLYVPTAGDRFWVGLRENDLQEEIWISKPHTVRVTRDGAIDVLKCSRVGEIPRKPGVYFIYVKKGSGPEYLNYVGKSDEIRQRFLDRISAFKDFGLDEGEIDTFLARTRVTWALVSLDTAAVVGKRATATGIKRGKKDSTAKALTNATLAALLVAERYFIQTLQPAKNSAQKTDPVKFLGTGSVTLLERQKDSKSDVPLGTYDSGRQFP